MGQKNYIVLGPFILEVVFFYGFGASGLCALEVGLEKYRSERDKQRKY